ncbi:hypothetical protein RRG08_025764 [Elysia crispata]|uniref:Uncharacterized protein n=1 Tax=Elysia crispata TaxID=231223 RepID=A0AAE1DYK9_9GAST|nr:hypothetical protein RRG08_025764 [Elysia crispata]
MSTSDGRSHQIDPKEVIPEHKSAHGQIESDNRTFSANSDHPSRDRQHPESPLTLKPEIDHFPEFHQFYHRRGCFESSEAVKVTVLMAGKCLPWQPNRSASQIPTVSSQDGADD